MSNGDNASKEANSLLQERALGWIQSADTKATALATLVALMSGFMGLQQDTSSQREIVVWVYRLFLLAASTTVSLCLAVLWPRVHRTMLLDSSGMKASPTFFGDVPDSFEAFKSRSCTVGELETDELEQTYVLARVAKKKMGLVKGTILAFGFTVVVLAVLSSLGRGSADAAAAQLSKPTGARSVVRETPVVPPSRVPVGGTPLGLPHVDASR